MNWPSEYSRSSSISSGSNFYPVSLDNTEDDDDTDREDVIISEYLEESDKSGHVHTSLGRPSWLEREMVERKQAQSQGSPEKRPSSRSSGLSRKKTQEIIHL